MSGTPVTVAHPQSRPVQFSLRQMAVWIIWVSVGLALFSQVGTWWGVVLWLAAGLGAMGYGAYRGAFQWTAAGMFVVLCVVGTGLSSGLRCGGGRAAWCQNNLKMIGLALHNYHDEHGCFPPACLTDTSGRPMHSWRVLLLPYLEQQDLYNRYDFSEPWDGPNNRLLAAEIPRVYCCPSDPQARSSFATSYLAVVGPATMWHADTGVAFREVTDGSRYTLLVVESNNSGILWMEPRDLTTLQMAATINSTRGQGICSCHACDDGGSGINGAHVVFVDGSVRRLSNETSAKSIDAALTIAGGETIKWP